MLDGITLKSDMTNCAADYSRRCQSIGMERKNPRDLDSAMRHSQFKERHHKLLDELSSEYEASRPIMERAPWKTVQLGTHKSHQDLRKALLKDGFKIGDWCDDILKRISVAPKPTTVELVLVTGAELGFPNGASRKNIYNKAFNFGLDPCPAEVGPQLRLQYSEQPNGEWILIGMEPIADSDGGLGVLCVAHDDYGRWLNGNNGRPGNFWDGDNRWVFCRKSPLAA